jgi:hypothetical protein
VTDTETLLTYFKKRARDLLVVTDQHPSLYADGTFDHIFVTAGDPLVWVEKVKAGGTLAGDCLLPEGLKGAVQHGEVWIKKL